MAAELFAYVGDLDEYPSWMPMIHEVERLSTESDETPLWSVELRANVGPLARSKRLRMRRTKYRPDELAIFERHENDGRQHSVWILRAELADDLCGGDSSDRPTASDTSPRTRLTMTMTYEGSLWAGPVLGRVLDDQVQRGSEALLELVT